MKPLTPNQVALLQAAVSPEWSRNSIDGAFDLVDAGLLHAEFAGYDDATDEFQFAFYATPRGVTALAAHAAWLASL